MTQKATEILAELPTGLSEFASCSNGERSAEDSMRNYKLLDDAAQAIEILKAMNLRDREQLQQKAIRKKDEEAPGITNALKYRVCPQEMEKTRQEMREIRERGSRITCLGDCMPTLRYHCDLWWTETPQFIDILRSVEAVMDKVRATAIQLRRENRDGHWAIGLLDFYSDAWIVYLDELCSAYWNYWCRGVLKEKVKDAEWRAKVAREIVREVEKEKVKMLWD